MNKNLIFRKKEDGSIEVLLRNGTAEDDFSYIEMIKYLLDGKKLGETEFDENITSMEQESLKKMLKEINETIEEKEALE
jgi:hypothetical protein